MDFQLNEEQMGIRKAAKEFAEGEFNEELALKYDASGTYPKDLWKKACQLGFAGIHFPDAFGGSEYGLLENCLIIEEFCRKDSGIGSALSLADFGSEIVLKHGNKSQKEKFLRPITTGMGMFTFAFLEEGSPSSPLSTVAVKHKGKYLINGAKLYVPNAEIADYLIVLCQTDNTKFESQSCFVLEKNTDGIEVFPMGERMGMRMIPFGKIVFKDVEAIEKSRVGEENKGELYLNDFLNEMRIVFAAMGVGIAQGGFDRAVEYAKQREAFGKRIADFPVIRDKLANMLIEIELARLITHKAASEFDNNRRIDHSLAQIAMIISSKTAYRVTYDAVDIFGGYGYMRETSIEHFYRDAKALDLFFETGQDLRGTIGKQIIGINS